MGKYIRHATGMLVAAIFGTLLPLLGINPELFDPDQAAQFTQMKDAFETALYIFGTFVWYPLTEKWLKRFKWLDLQGWIDRLWLKKEARVEESAPGAVPRI